MNLTRDKKAQLLAKLRERMDRAKVIVIAEYHGTKVADIEKIRQEAFDNQLDFQVAKNTLLKKVAEEKGIVLPDEIFDKAITLMWGYEDEVLPAKTLQSYAKQLETIKPLGLVLDGKYYPANQVVALANLPSKQELLAKLLGTMNAPIANFVYVLNANIGGLVNALEQIKKQKESNN